MGRFIISHVADFAIWLPAISVDTVTERGQGHARISGLGGADLPKMSGAVS